MIFNNLNHPFLQFYFQTVYLKSRASSYSDSATNQPTTEFHPPMATYNLSSSTHPNSSRLVSSNLSSQITPTVSFYQIPKSSLLFPTISIRPTVTRIESKNRGRCSSLLVSALRKISEADLVAVPPETDSIPGLFPSASGVYAVYNASGDLQFIGISRNVAASVLAHRNSVPELCSSIKVSELACA